MKAVEKGQEGASATIHGIEKSVAALQLAVASIDMLFRRSGDFRTTAGARPSSRSRAGES